MLDALNDVRRQYGERVRKLRRQIVPSFGLARENGAVAGQIGGEIRLYRQALIVLLTDWALQQTVGVEPTKYRVQAWQKFTFGRAVSNNVAVRWCDPSRDSGERGSLAIDPTLATASAQIFAVYRSAPDRPFTPQDLELVEQALESLAAAPA